ARNVRTTGIGRCEVSARVCTRPVGRSSHTLHGELRRKSLGIYRHARGVVGGEVRYSEARAEAERVISEARHGRDPFIGLALLRNANISTFEGLCVRFLADPAPGRKGRVLSEVTRAGITRIIRKELVPPWGHRGNGTVLPITSCRSVTSASPA